MAIEKVKDPLKKATDPVLLAHLKRERIDPSYVEFKQDYAARGPGRNPYSKCYRDKKSGKSFLVCSGLPMCRADGTKLTPGWKRRGGKFHAKTNLFTGTVEDNGRIALSPTNRQPNGMRTSDTLSWDSRFYLSGIEIFPTGEPALIPIDPINSNLSDNTIERDYGPCKWRIRTVRGRLRERWIFTESPGADVRIVHNHTGKGLRLGEYAVDDDIEIIPLSVFQQAEYPFEISASATFYPDEHEEQTSVDGHTYRSVAGEDWATIKAGAGTGASDDLVYLNSFFFRSGTDPNWKIFNRAIAIFDASAINGIVTASSLSFYGVSKTDNCNITPAANIYSANPSSNTEIVAADHATLGTAPFCDTNITYAAWSIAAGYNNVFDFNAAGITAIQAALDGDGIVKLGIRDALYDVGSSTPTHPGSTNLDTFIRAYSADKGSGFEPKLIIEYSPDVYKSLSASFEVEASLGRKLTFPLSSLMEIEAEAPFQLLKSLSTTIEVEAEGGKLLTFPLSALVEVEADLPRKLTFPLSSVIEVEAEATLHIGLLKSLLVTLEVEAEAGRSLTFPITPTVEVEAVAPLQLIKALSAMIEVEAAGGKILTFPIGPLVEVEVESGRLLTFPLSGLIEVDVFAGHYADIYKAISALLEVEADCQIAFIWSFIKDHQIQLDIWNTEQHIH